MHFFFLENLYTKLCANIFWYILKEFYYVHLNKHFFDWFLRFILNQNRYFTELIINLTPTLNPLGGARSNFKKLNRALPFYCIY